MQFDVKGWGTIRPVKESGTWGDIALHSSEEGGDGYGDYLRINSFTDEGLDKIAAYNNYGDEWEDEKKPIHRRNSYDAEAIRQLQTVCEIP